MAETDDVCSTKPCQSRSQPSSNDAIRIIQLIGILAIFGTIIGGILFFLTSVAEAG